MTKGQIVEAALALDPEEQLYVARALWDNVEPEPAELPPQLKTLLESRRAEALENPGVGETWETVKAERWPDL